MILNVNGNQFGEFCFLINFLMNEVSDIIFMSLFETFITQGSNDWNVLSEFP